MIYIYFTGEYEDIEINFISEDLSEFKQYVASNYVNYYYGPGKKRYYDIPTVIQIWDKENKCFKNFSDGCVNLYIGEVKTLEELISVLEKEL